MSDILKEWINPKYLDKDNVQDIIESIRAKPCIKYAVLDDFFNRNKLDELIQRHQALKFSEELDRRAPNGEWLPYDGAVVFATPKIHYGSDLFFSPDWHQYLCSLIDHIYRENIITEVKLRWHKPDADGFWIHSDGTIRNLVAIWYFNKNWRNIDGGLLQLWRQDEASHDATPVINSPSGRLDILTQHKRIRTSTPGGGFPDNKPHDLVLIDQIVPTYNRLFICDFIQNPAYHSVTPSNGRARTGVVQWLKTH